MTEEECFSLENEHECKVCSAKVDAVLAAYRSMYGNVEVWSFDVCSALYYAFSSQKDDQVGGVGGFIEMLCEDEGEWFECVRNYDDERLEFERRIREDMRLEKQEELRAYLGETTWEYCMQQAKNVKRFRDERMIAPHIHTDEELEQMFSEMDFDALFK